MKLKSNIKKACILFVQRLLCVFYIFPIDNNKILFSSFDGTQYADSPKFISEFYRDNNKTIKRVWVFDKKVINKTKIPKDVLYVKKGTFAYYYHFFTSKEIVINDFISTVMKLRRNQYLLNTWHGGGSFKTVGFTAPDTSDYDQFFFEEHAKNTSAYVLSSEFFGKAVINESFHFYGTELKTGMPRNSCLFEIRPDIKKRVEEFFHINCLDDFTTVLYAPTFRSDRIKNKIEESENEIDLSLCIRAIEKKFGKPVKFIYRAHHMMDKKIVRNVCLDGTSYPDIQDLIYCSNILISDYSSCMWDFAIMRKPIFQYVPDLSEYTKDRNFLLPIERWNFILARNNKELENKIENYNRTEYINGIEDYLEEMNSYDNVDSTKLVCEWLDMKRGEKK